MFKDFPIFLPEKKKTDISICLYVNCLLKVDIDIMPNISIYYYTKSPSEAYKIYLVVYPNRFYVG